MEKPFAPMIMSDDFSEHSNISWRIEQGKQDPGPRRPAGRPHPGRGGVRCRDRGTGGLRRAVLGRVLHLRRRFLGPLGLVRVLHPGLGLVNADDLGHCTAY